MWECNYAAEALDLKLLLVRFLKRIWIPILSTFLGAALLGGAYFVKNVVLAGPDRYEKTSIYFVDYKPESTENNIYYYINSYTWNEWVRTDEFVDRVLASMEGSGYELSKEEVRGYLTAELPSDLRMPYSTVTTYDPELTEALGKALEQAFVVFGENHSEINGIRVSDSGLTHKVVPDLRTLRAVILGGVCGLLGALITMLIVFLLDDSVYVPGTFTYRYRIPALGVVYAGKRQKQDPFLQENISHVFRGGKRIALVCTEPGEDPQEAVRELAQGEFEYICVPSLEQTPKAASLLREADGVLLFVKCGARNDKRIQQVLDFLRIQEVSVQGAVLKDGDGFINRWYYGKRFGGKKR